MTFLKHLKKSSPTAYAAGVSRARGSGSDLAPQARNNTLHDARTRFWTPAFAGVTILLLMLFVVPAMAAEKAKESVYDRVQRTNTLRCGYIVYPPDIIKDVNTGKLTGALVDTVEAVGRELGIKIDWAEEVSFTSMFEGVLSDRYDALCAGLFENAARSRTVLFTVPSNYSGTYAFARADDKRFDGNVKAIDSDAVTIALIDGEIAQSIAERQFPQAKRLALPQSSDVTMVMESVATKKADIAILPKNTADGYMKNNPGKIKQVDREPVRAYPSPPMVFAPDEIKLKLMFDTAIRAVQLDGSMEKILRKYDPNLDTYRLVAKPYEGLK